MLDDRFPSNDISNDIRPNKEELVKEFKKNLRELMNHLDEGSLNTMLSNWETAIIDIPVPVIWQEHIQQCFEKWMIALPDARLIPLLLDQWKFLRNPTSSIWEAVNVIARFGAGSVKRLVDKYSFYLENMEIRRPSGNERKALEQRIREACQYLHACGIIGKKHLDAKILGSGRLEVDIWFAPEHLRMPGIVEKEITFYAESGGRRTTKSDPGCKKTDKDYDESAEREINYKEKVRKKRSARRINSDAKKGIFYSKCPHCHTVIQYDKNDLQLYKISGTRIESRCHQCNNPYREIQLPSGKNKFLEKVIKG